MNKNIPYPVHTGTTGSFRRGQRYWRFRCVHSSVGTNTTTAAAAAAAASTATAEGVIVNDVTAASTITARATTASVTTATTIVIMLLLLLLLLSPLPQIRVTFTMSKPHLAHHDYRDNSGGWGKQR